MVAATVTAAVGRDIKAVLAAAEEARHARPAGALAVAAANFSSAVSLTVGASSADAKSVLAVMGLGATSGQHVTVAAEVPDAEEAVATIVAIVAEAIRVGA